MIEFKGKYSIKSTGEFKSVLVQFDGVLLHVWQLANPFCRLLTSDVFKLQTSIGNKYYIKLPDGTKIVTDDLNGFDLLRKNYHTLNDHDNNLFSPKNMLIGFSALAIIVSTILLFS